MHENSFYLGALANLPDMRRDSLPNRHSSKHARAAAHPVIASAQPGERWLYYFADEAFAEY
jgi:hypothetical protein